VDCVHWISTRRRRGSTRAACDIHAWGNAPHTHIGIRSRCRLPELVAGFKGDPVRDQDPQAAEVFSCDVASGAVKQVTQTNSVISIADISADGKTVVGTFNNPGQSTEIYRLTFRSVERITDHNGWLKEYALGDAEVVRWKSKDGAEIEGVLTKPVGFNALRKYPFLVNPHGGPTGASLTSFNATSQLLAANGYLILQPNFRGSIGRGEKFAMANKNTWGLFRAASPARPAAPLPVIFRKVFEQSPCAGAYRREKARNVNAVEVRIQGSPVYVGPVKSQTLEAMGNHSDGAS
jgi:Prolyl oligopeptidase family